MVEEPRRVAVMLFLNVAGEVLLQLRDDIPTIRYPGHWGVTGGGVEVGETVEEALLREVAEEIEETPEHYEYWDAYHSATSQVSIFAARLDKPAEALRLHEGQRLQFFTPQEAMTLALVPWLAQVLPDFVRSDVYRGLCPDAISPGNREASSIIFIRPNGDLLLRLRSDLPGLPFRAMWDLIGGAIEDDDASPLEAAKRETSEELSLALEEAVHWGDIQGIVMIHVYVAPLDTPADALYLTEGERVAWVAPETALELPLVPYMRMLIPALLASDVYAELRGGRGATEK
jgi:8-oxo-dGTP diphosphatase